MRRELEWLLRLALVVVLALSLWRSVRGSHPGATTLSLRAAEADEALQRATTSPRVGAVHVAVDGTLSHEQVAWLVALRRSGVKVEWSGGPPPLAVEAERSREPVATTTVRLAADSGAGIVLADSVGVIDSVRASRGAMVEAPDVTGAVSARRGAWWASARVPAREERRDVLVLGRAGWEGRFLLDALGEAGWHVRARLAVAPGVSMVDASLLPIDTARYDAVVVLDSSAADLVPAMTRFVAQGGGAIIMGNALGLDALRGIAPARAGDRRAGRILLTGDTLTRADLPLRALTATTSDAVILERRPAGVAVVVRRAGAGRVAAIGYDETWRWRMEGGPSGAAAHRAWWSRMTGAVSPARAAGVGAALSSGGDAAPRAALIDALGPSTEAAAQAPQSTPARLPLVLLLVIAAALLAETASRRFRGAT